MEKIKNSSRNYYGSRTDPALRLQARPSQKKAGIFGDDDMSAPTRFQQSSQNKPSRSASRVLSEDENSSDDPLDSFSESSPKKSRKDDRHKRALASQPSVINAKSEGLKKLGRIPKNKASNTEGGATMTKPGSVSNKDGSQFRSDVKDIFSSPPPPPPPRARSKAIKTGQPSSSTVQRDKSPSPPPAQTSRPRPRPVNKADRTASKTLTPAPFPLGRDSSLGKPSRDNDESDSVQPQPYPTLSPPRTSSVTPPSDRADRKKAAKAQRYPMVVDSTERSISKKPQAYPLEVDSGSRNAKKAKSTATRQPQAFPMTEDSRLRESTGKAASTRVSPPSTSKKGKGSRKIVLTESEDDSDDASSLRAKAAPFPLSNELPTPNDAQFTKKRLSSGSSSSDSSPRKRTRPGDTEVGDASLVDAYAFVEDSFLETVDPNTLCPYCDSPLPPSPSPTLCALLEAMEKKSYPDPRPTNLRGRKAPFSAFISLCQRHRFESEILPEAKSKGWPSTIDWTRLSQRIENMKSKLRSLIDDDSEDGPRAKSAAWNEIMQLVKEKGSRAATGIKDQFLNFEKTQPGYYGELGSLIIHQTLYNLFPPSSIDVESVAPLGAEEFLQRVLLPEVALRLIMEDQRLRGTSGRKQALQILRDSSAYGVAMFPAEQSANEAGSKKGSAKNAHNAVSGGSGLSRNTKEGLTAGESIIMERARKRRKEIEEEEAREMEEEEVRARVAEEEERRKLAVEQKEVVKAKPRPRPLAKGASKGSLMEVDVNIMSSSKSDSDSGRDETRYDMDPADDRAGKGKGKGKGTERASSRASRTKPSTRAPSPLWSDSDESSSRVPMGKVNERTRKGGEGRKRSGWSSPETDVIEIEEENDGGFSTNMKTPKAKPFPMEVVEDAPTPRPSRLKQSSGSGSQRPDTDLPPLLRARARAEAKEKAKAQTKDTEVPKKKGGGGWLHSMREDAFAESSGADSDGDRARSGRKKDAGGKAPASSLKSRQQRTGSSKASADESYDWLLD